MRSIGVWLLVSLFLGILAGGVAAESLDLPPRPSNALSGAQLIRVLEPMPTEEREARLWHEILNGNVPAWNREFVSVPFTQLLNGSNYSGFFCVLPDYLAVGSDQDYFLAPMTPRLGQQLADRFGCTLPTRKMVSMIWTNAVVKLTPQTIPPSKAMATVRVFAVHNVMVRDQRNQRTNGYPLGALVAGHKKDVVVSSKIYTNFATTVRKPVVIYGWHYPSGNPIQPLYNGHRENYADYSHGIRLVLDRMSLNGRAIQVSSLLRDPETAALLSDEGAAEGTTNAVIALPRYTVEPAQR